MSALFFVIDVVSPLEIRYALQALPLLALLGGLYLASAFDRGPLGKAAGAAAIVYIVVTGVTTLHEIVLTRYH